MNKNTFGIIKNVLMFLFLIILLTLLIFLLITTKDNHFIKNVREFINDDTKVLYISDTDNYSNYPTQILDKYDIQFLYIDSTNLSKIEKVKLEKMINSKYLSNILVIFKDGKVEDAIIDYKTEDSLNKFLQNHDIIPQVIGNIDGIIDLANKSLEMDLAMLYIPYKYVAGIDSQDDMLKKISNEYGIKYKMINSYLLSYKQQEKLNSILQISSVEDQIIILIKDGKIVGGIRGIKDYDYYVDGLHKYNFITDDKNYLNEIDYDKFNDIVASGNKHVIVIVKDECKYCKEVMSTLNSIITDYKISINYINVGKLDSELSNKVEKKLVELGYLDGFTTPITLVTESNNIVDYVIGASTKRYFIDIFNESGIIK